MSDYSNFRVDTYDYDKASEPGFKVQGCVKVPAKPRASAQAHVSALKPWSRNGNIRPRVSSRWGDMAPILAPVVPVVAVVPQVPDDGPAFLSILACDVLPGQRLRNGETVRSTCRHAVGAVSLRTRRGDVRLNPWDSVEVHA